MMKVMAGNGRLQYLPGLDGIRALAVLAVLLFHAGFDVVSGGFLGVSAFFTLSGFLITTLVLREYGATGRVDLRAFWSRRVRRLLPALLVAFAGIVVFAATVASTTQQNSVADDGPWALLYLANWRFISEGQSYASLFNGDATSPLLHLWSLAIEEQFYVVLPLVAVVVLRGASFRRNLALVAGAGLAWSLVATAVLAAGDAELSRIYYGTDTRAAELLIGVLGAVAVDSRRDLIERPAARAVAPIAWTALSLMGLLWVTTDETTVWLHQGGFAVHAMLTLVVVLAAATPGSFATALSWSPLVAVGRISYGLYLFHWPVYLWLTPERTDLSSVPLFLVRVAVSFGIAAASYRLVEQPVRHSTFRFGPLPVGLVAMLAALLATVPASAGPTTVVFDPIFSADEVLQTAAAAEPADDADPAEPTSTAVETPDQPTPTPELEPLRTGPPRVLLVGDSVALTLGRGFELHAVNSGDFQVLNAGQIGCAVGRGGAQLVYGRVTDEFDHCAHENWDRLLADFDPDVVVLLSGVWDLKGRRLAEWTDFLKPGDALFDEWLFGEYVAAIDRLGSTGAEVALVRPACLERFDQNGDPVTDDEFEPGRLDAYRAAVIDPLAAAGVTLFDLDVRVCENGSPILTFPGVPGEVRPDGVHFTELSAEVIAAEWSPRLVELALDSRTSDTPE